MKGIKGAPVTPQRITQAPQREVQAPTTPTTKRPAESGKSTFDQKVDNKYASGVEGGKKLDHAGAIELANKVFADSVIGDVCDQLLAECDTEEQAYKQSARFARAIVQNRRLDPEARRAALHKIGEKFGQRYAPDKPQEAKAAADFFYKQLCPEGLENATTSIRASGYTPKELAHQQLQSHLYAMGLVDSPL